MNTLQITEEGKRRAATLEFAITNSIFVAELSERGVYPTNISALVLIAWVLSGHSAETIEQISDPENADTVRALAELMNSHTEEIRAVARHCCELMTEYFDTTVQ